MRRCVAVAAHAVTTGRMLRSVRHDKLRYALSTRKNAAKPCAHGGG